MNQVDKILFSIIIPTYNRAHLISKAIQSVLDQTYNHWELVIVDDGSTDNTEEVVHKFNDQRIRYFRKNHEERSVARNFGIEKSRGLYISFLDDDDYYLAEFLEEFNRIIEKEKRPIGYFMCLELIEIHGKKKLNPISKKYLEMPTRLIWKVQPSIRPFAIHKDIFIENKFNIDCKYGQDHELITRISLRYKFYYIDKPLSVNLEHEEQGTKTKFGNEFHINAIISLNCIKNLINSNSDLKKTVPNSELYHINNHIVYGYASASMKHFDFSFFKHLFLEFDSRGNFYRLIYYILSLIFRLPFYYLKSKFSK